MAPMTELSAHAQRPKLSVAAEPIMHVFSIHGLKKPAAKTSNLSWHVGRTFCRKL